MSATRAVIDFILETNIRDFPERLLSEGRRCVLDGTGVILAGSTDACSRIVQDQIAAQGGHAEATLLGLPDTRAPAPLAARANGTAGHAMDFDDTQLSNAPDRIFGLLTHPTVAPLSAGYAMAERVGATGAEFLEAFLIGFEVECKIAEAIDPGTTGKGSTRPRPSARSGPARRPPNWPGWRRTSSPWRSASRPASRRGSGSGSAP